MCLCPTFLEIGVSSCPCHVVCLYPCFLYLNYVQSLVGRHICYYEIHTCSEAVGGIEKKANI